MVLALGQVAPVILPTAPAQAAPLDGPWGAANHGYRLPVEITPTADGSALYVPVAVDFTAAFVAAGVSGLSFDPTTLLVHEVDFSGVIASAATSFQFDPGPAFDPINAAVGELVLEVVAPTTLAQTRSYLVYFDALGSAASGADVTDQVVVSTGLFDEGEPAISIDTPTGEWWYQDQAGGFSSLLDPAGADWINWSTQMGSSGEFRGIPNLVFPAGFFHPGSTGHTTTVDIDGPVHVRLTTLSPDGLWEMQWDLYPSHAQATVLAANSPYWFLYEGTPGGAVDETSDFWADSSGSTATLDTAFTGDIADPEWIQFGDPIADRSLFAIHHTPGTETDSYRTLDSTMTVFGFGRSGLTSLLSGADRDFSVGLLDTANRLVAADAIEAVRSTPTVLVGPGQSQIADVTSPVIVVGPASNATSDTIDITWTTGEVATSEVSFGLTSALELGTVTTSGYVFEHLVSLTALSCDTTFYTAVTTVDSSGNSTTSATTTTDTTVCEYPLDVSVVGNGSVTLSPDQATYLPGTIVQLTADPNEGESFIGWSGAATGSTPTVDVIMPAAQVSVTGTFSEPMGPVPVVRYGFGEGSGVVVGDSGSGVALDLVIDDLGQAVWVAGGLELSGAALVSSGPASKVFDAVGVSGEMTIEAWVDPADVSQGGPARIVSSASGPLVRNFMLGQGAYGSLPDDVFASRVRTSSSVGGTPTMFTPSGSAGLGLTHVVLTRDSAGLQTLYIDGVSSTTSTVTGDVSNWDPSFPLSVGNISTGDRPWNGTVCLVAIYDVVLTATEAATNHGAGCSQVNIAPVIAPAVGDQSSGEGQTVSLQVSAADSNGDTLLYSATGLPAGLTIGSNTGLISGTIAAGEAATSLFAVTVTVDDQNGETVTENLSWTVTVNTAPTISSAVGDQTSAEGDTISVQISASDADSDPLTYTATGLPANLTINTATGLISGVLSQTSANGSPHAVTVTVDDSNGGTDTENLTWTITPVNVTPVMAAIADQSSFEASSVSLQTSATDDDGDALLYSASGLPAGLTINAATGLISGTVAAGEAATSLFAVTVTVDDQNGETATANLTWIVIVFTGPVPVVRYGFGEGSGVVVGDSGSGVALDLVIDDLGQAVWVAGGLELSGAALVSSGPASKVFDAVGVSGEMTIEAWVDPADVSQGGPARIVSSASGPLVRNFMLGQGAYGSLPDDVFASRVRTSSSVGGTPTMFTPSGSAGLGLTHVVLTRDSAGLQTLYIDGVSSTTSTVTGDVSNWDPSFPLSVGNISTGDRPWNGTVCLVAIYDVVLTATEAATNHGAGCSQVNIAPVIAPAVGDQSSGEGQTVSLQVSAADSNGDTLLYSATGLPAGLTIGSNTGLISGTIAAGEAATSLFAVTVTVDDQNGETVTENLSWTVTVNTAPTISSAVGDQTSAEGDTISVQISASDADSDPLTYTATGLPANLTINTATGLISGVLSQTSANGSPHAVTVTVDDSNGGTDTENLTWTITPVNVTPVMAAIADQSSFEASSVSLQTSATDDDGDALLYSASGLPAGLTINAATGLISGTVAAGEAATSLFAVTVTVDDQNGETATANLTWIVIVFTGPVPVVRYGFGEGSGVVVGDSGSGVALDLVIDDLGQAVWVAGGLELSGAALVSSGPASKVFDAVGVSGEMTIEAWVDPADVSQGGPARIVSSASGPLVRNFMLGQGAYGSLPDDVFASRVRTSSSVGGTPTMFTPSGSAGLGLTHVVLTRDSAGLQTLYIDGVSSTTSTVTGDVSNWDPSFPLSVGNISTGDRPWNGTVCLVAIYDVVLTATEAATNHGAGCSQVNIAPVIAPAVGDQSSGEGQTVSLQVSAADSNGDTLLYSATGLPAGLTIGSNTGLISGTIAAGEAATSLFAVTVTVDDQNGETVTENLSWTVTVNTAPTISSAVGDQTSAEGDTISVQISASDADSDPLTYTATGLPANLTINTATGLISGVLSQTSANGSPHAVTVTVDDSNGGTDTENLTWTITPVNVTPVATDDSYTTLLDVPLVRDATLGVLANDADGDDDPLQALLVDDVTNGLLALDADGSFTYTPDAGFAGADGFTYRTTDGPSQSSLASVTIQVTSTDEPLQIVTGTVGWEKQIIDTTALETHIALGADLDGDGDNDIVSTSLTNDEVRWYENDGAGGFIAGIIDANLDAAYPAHVDDVDGDGDIDVLAAGYLADTFVWYENDGAANFTRHVIDGSSDGAHSIVTVDMDDDGDKDLVTSSQDADRIAWYENDGSENFTLHILDAASDGAKWAEPADVDNDGDVDVLAINFFGDQVSWFENDGSENFTKRVIDATANGGYFLAPADIDADGDLDLFTASQRDNTIAWHENDGSENFTKRVIDGGARGARSVIAADVDGDGDTDAIAATVDNDTVAWYENDGTGSFVVHAVDLGAEGAYGVSALDFDLDGDIDILGASRDDATVALYRQLRVHSAHVPQGSALTIDSSLLMTVDDDNGPSNVVYTVTEAPDFGTLSLSGAALSGGSTFNQADIDQNLLIYTHNGIGNETDTFLFSVAATSGSSPSALGSFEIGIIDPAALLVHLELDEGSGTNATDSSINGNNATLMAGASFEADTADGSPSAVRLDGTNDTIALPNIDVDANGLTLALWMNPDTFTFGDARLISKATSTAANGHIFMLGTILVGSEHRLRGRVRIGGVTTTVIASNGLLLPGSWRHAALTHDGSFVRLYLDGTEVGSALADGSIDTDPTIPVAVGAQPPGAGGRYFDGLVDDIRILERAMGSAEIATIAGGGTL